MKFERTIPKLIRSIAQKHPETSAQLCHTKKGEITEVNYHDMFQLALDFGASLLDLGVKRGDRIGLIADNRKEWEQADIGLLSIGAIDVPRGCDATEKDLSFILSFSECSVVIAENNAQVKKYRNVNTYSIISAMRINLVFIPHYLLISEEASASFAQNVFHSFNSTWII